MAGSRFSNLKYQSSEFQPELTKTFVSIAKLTPSILHLKDAVDSNSKIVAITSATNNKRKSRAASSIAALPAAVSQSSSIQSLAKGIDDLSSSSQDPNLSVKDRSIANNQLDKIDKKLALLTQVTKLTSTDQLADIEKILRTNENVVSKLDKLSTTIVNVSRTASNDSKTLSRQEESLDQAKIRQIIGALENPNIYLNQSVDSVTKTLLITNSLLKDLIKESEKQSKYAKDQAKGGGGLLDLLGSLLGGGLGGRLGRRGRVPGRGGRAGRAPRSPARRIPGGEAFRKNPTRTTTTSPRRTPPASASRTAGKAATLGTVAAGTTAAERATEKSLGKTAAKTAGKSLVKKVPLVGALAGLGFAAGRAWDGDWSGAGLEALSGIASIVPVVGTAASVALDAALLAKDLSEEEESETSDTSSDIDSAEIGEEVGDKVKEALEDTEIKITVPKGLVANQSNNLNSVAGSQAPTPQLNSQGVPVTLAPMTDTAPRTPSVSNAIRNSTEGLPNVIGSGLGNLSDTIAKFESKGDYNIYNQGAGHRYKVGRTDFSQMTLDDVLARQNLDKNDPNKLFAIGKYQIIPETLKEAKNKLGLKGDEMFTPEMQDKIFTDYLMESKRPQLANFIKTGQNLEGAALSGAQEWASIGVASKGDKSYYAGDGINKAHLSSGEFKNSLMSAHEAYKANLAKGMSEDEAYRQSLLGNVPQASASTTIDNKSTQGALSNTQITSSTPLENRNLAFPRVDYDKGPMDQLMNGRFGQLFDQGRDGLSSFAKSMGYDDIGNRLKSKPDLRLAVGPLSNEITVDPKYTPKGWKGSGFELGRGTPEAEISTARIGQSRYNNAIVQSSQASPKVEDGTVAASSTLSPTPDYTQTNSSGVIPVADLSKLEIGSKVGSGTDRNNRGNMAAAHNPLDSNRGTPSHGMKGSESPTHIDDLGIVLINTGML